MDALRWTGEAFTLGEEILTADEYAAWLTGEGDHLLTQSFEGLSGKWLFGRKRARSHALRIVRGAVYASKPDFKQSLDRLPAIIGSLAIQIYKNGPPGLVEKELSRGIALVPRTIVQNNYELSVKKDIVNSRTLSRFKGLSELLIGRLTGEGEALFFDSLGVETCFLLPQTGAAVLQVDSTFDWKLSRSPGHYLVGYAEHPPTDLSNWKLRKGFLSDMGPLLRWKKAGLENMPREEMEKVRAYFASVLTSFPR